MSKILNTNIVTALLEIQEAVREGYRVVPGKSFLSTAFIFDIDLHKEDVAVTTLDVIQKVPEQTIEEYDADVFLQEMQRLILNGYDINLDSVWWNSAGAKVAKMVLSTNPLIKDWTEDELKEMSYEGLKAIAQYRGVFNKAKGVMINNILKSNSGGF